jgi:hypothetical protein
MGRETVKISKRSGEEINQKRGERKRGKGRKEWGC